MPAYETILFDLDGTLLPMDQDKFLQAYMGALGQKCAALGQPPKDTIDAIWAGTAAMVQNDGSAPNHRRFWQVFQQRTGADVQALEPAFDTFYANEFNTAQSATLPNPLAARLVKALKAAGVTTVLATNPLFPKVAVQSRLGWLGLSSEDFNHITSYENSSYCKPNPQYYAEILATLGKPAAGSLMVGNDVGEDGAAAKLGIDVYIVTDWLLNPDKLDYSAMPQGSFAQCAAWLNERQQLGLSLS